MERGLGGGRAGTAANHLASGQAPQAAWVVASGSGSVVGSLNRSQRKPTQL